MVAITSAVRECPASNCSWSADDRLIHAPLIRFSEIISALSVALDITQGHPQGHSMRSCLIGMRLAESLELSASDRSALFYALLLKDLGCSSNAAKIAHLFGADDQRIKRSIRMVDWTKPVQGLCNCWNECAPGGSTLEKIIRMAAIVRSGEEGARKITEIRCERGADIARMLQLSEATAQAILDLDEHWNGSGSPKNLKRTEISLLGRICGLAQTVEVFHDAYGLDSACEMAQSRRNTWFDPELVDILHSIRSDEEFWGTLQSSNLLAEISRWEPQDTIVLADDERLDRIAEAFARVIDAKSPWTFAHSSRVAEIAVGIADQLGRPAEQIQDIRRAGLLHDIGKLGVSNLILDKPGKPTEDEFAQIRRHAEYSEIILKKVAAFDRLAEVAGGHHERLDGRGYHRGLAGAEIPLVTRMLTVADVCEAMTAKRPYRDAMQWDQVHGILTKDIGKAFDGDCVEALVRWHDVNHPESRVPLQLTAVEQIVSELRK